MSAPDAPQLRLSELAARLVRSTHATDGRGYRAWDARRQNQFYRQAQVLAASVKRPKRYPQARPRLADRSQFKPQTRKGFGDESGI